MKISKKLECLVIIISIILGINTSMLFNYSKTLYTKEGLIDYNKLNKLKPKISDTHTSSIVIDDRPGSLINWTWALMTGICSGSGFDNDPYLITYDTFNVTSGIALTIKNSHDEYFKIESCSFINVGERHLKLDNVSKGIVTNCDFSDRKTFGIEIIFAQDLTISHNTFENLIDTAIWAQSSSNIIIIDNSITEDEGGLPSYINGIHLKWTNYSYIKNNEISGIDYDDAAGVRITYGYHNIIISNEIYDTEEINESTHHGIHLIESLKNNISQNIIYNTDNGIVLSNSHNNRIYDNAIYDSIQGITLDHSEFNLVLDNTAYSSVFGIKLSYSYNNTILKNNVNNNNDGIALFQSKENDILENIVQNNGEPFSGFGTGNGISLQQYSEGNVVSLNLIENNSYNIFIWMGKDNQIIKNTIQNGNIYLYYCYYRNVISNNTIVGGLIFSSNADDHIISYNNLTYSGISFSKDSNNNTIFKNSISHCSTGIRIATSDNNQILENNISYNNLGIGFYSANYNNVSGNHFFCNNESIDDQSYQNYFSNNTFEDCPPEEKDGMKISGYHSLVYISIILIGMSIFINFLKKRIKIK